ncbi:MAG: glycosyltransferase family 4 protein [Candidatus Aureabacteria bacterium]|nr:glycosyltransferase family 4 protein [Candidatus Auribacterota bacterium]
MHLGGAVNILITVNSFASLTGSELYCYELAREYRKRGHSVTVAAGLVGGIVAEKARGLGVRVVGLESVPDDAYDVLHVNQHQAGARAAALFKRLPVVNTIHSEHPALEKFERPLSPRRVARYIAIRPSIADALVRRFRIPAGKIEVVCNPIDFSRFNREGTSDNGRPLFAGPDDFLRRGVIERWQGKADFIGRGFATPPVWNIEDRVKRCAFTLGISLGRTTIEGWACVKKGFIYEVDERGNILSEREEPPPEDISRFDSSRVAESLIEIYQSVYYFAR